MPMSADVAMRSRFLAGGLIERGNSSSAVELGPMTRGNKYLLTADVAAYFYQTSVGGTAVTSTTGFPLAAGEKVVIACDDGTEDAVVSIIAASGTAVTHLWRMG